MASVRGLAPATHIFAGNKRDALTVPTVLDALKQRFGLRRVVFVGDRGMVTTDHLERLRTAPQGYVVGLTWRRNDTVYRYIESATGPWIECPGGRTAQGKSGGSPPAGG
jgi:hypothetical protein